MTAGNDGKPQTQPGLLQILEQLAPEDLHRDVWAACMAPRWFFGNRSTDAQSSRPFWKMDLEGVDAVDRLWRHAQLECERLAGPPLLGARKSPTGHTYGPGARPP